MSRNPLIHIPGGIYSVVSKCNNDEFHFNADDKFNFYLIHLLTCKKKLGFELYDIVCMSNHVHELYRVPQNVTISQILQLVKGRFAWKYNLRYHRRHHFWQNKPFYRIVEDEQYAFCLMNYFHWNPVKAGMVDHPAKWPYSGYRFHILGAREGILGKLLSPLPELDVSGAIVTMSPEMMIEIHAILSNHKVRFIGTTSYRHRMKRRYKPGALEA